MVSEHHFHSYCFIAIILVFLSFLGTWKFSKNFKARWNKEIDEKKIADKELRDFSIYHLLTIFIFANICIDAVIGLCVHLFGIL